MTRPLCAVASRDVQGSVEGPTGAANWLRTESPSGNACWQQLTTERVGSLDTGQLPDADPAWIERASAVARGRTSPQLRFMIPANALTLNP